MLIEITDKSYSPHAKIAVNRGEYFLVQKRSESIVFAAGNNCSFYYLDSEDNKVLNFGWSIGCLSGEIEKSIAFDIVDASGVTIGREKIPFRIKRDGEYVLRDAL